MRIIFSIVFLLVVLAINISAVRFGSFNLQQYGPKKSANETLTDLVAKILNDFDVAVIQEITDAAIKAPYVLFDALNKISKSKPYTMTLSERVGRTSTKEQYIFFNRESTSGVKLIDYYLYNDVQDYFERPPFIGTFEVTKPGSSGVRYFTIMDVHLRPDSAYQELLDMRRVIHDFILKNPRYFTDTSTSLSQALAANVIGATSTNKPNLKTNHPILIMGDFNADCTYISLTRQGTLRSIDFADFTWVINNEVKTNTRQTCTYDRIFINGDKFVKAIVPRSNTTVDFPQRFGMTMEQALGISDHLPIKFDINF
ncbi:unnamed protein product [Adineta steineri]|uniref:Deoxyribonuclease n=1 Tax=Adineta steineri TaxID=433720 RepID=A0A813P3B9_9BILA|nr:unnamed protein product [Adineta steineri]CAF0968277.1 unnamed protein product [Adineta steineri]